MAGRRNRKRAYGFGYIRPPRKPGGAWLIRWREGSKRRSMGGFTTREHAERVLAKIAGEAALNRVGLPRESQGCPDAGGARPSLSRTQSAHAPRGGE